jgi:ABC-2 type transport system ATP-binding protein
MIETFELTKQYPKTLAVDRLSLTVAAGEIFGLLGPNGAGKTTTIRMLTTLTKPTSGWARISGFDVVQQPLKVKELISVCPQEINVDRELTAYENLLVFGKLYDLQDLKARIAVALEFGDLADRAQDRVQTFSGGMQRRLLIARAFLSSPRVLFLDEPTVGLDPQVRRQVWDMIRRLKTEGVTVMLTTHYIEEAEALCDRVGILSHGRLIALDAPGALNEQVGGFVVESLDRGRKKYLLVKDKEAAYALAQSEPEGVIIRETNLEDVFIKLTGERLAS